MFRLGQRGFRLLALLLACVMPLCCCTPTIAASWTEAGDTPADQSCCSGASCAPGEVPGDHEDHDRRCCSCCFKGLTGGLDWTPPAVEPDVDPLPLVVAATAVNTSPTLPLTVRETAVRSDPPTLLRLRCALIV